MASKKKVLVGYINKDAKGFRWEKDIFETTILKHTEILKKPNDYMTLRKIRITVEEVK